MTQMGGLWRSYKSRVVKEIRDAQNHAARMNLRKFVKEKTSPEFQVIQL